MRKIVIVLGVLVLMSTVFMAAGNMGKQIDVQNSHFTNSSRFMNSQNVSGNEVIVRGFNRNNGSAVQVTEAVCDGSCEEPGQALQDGTGNMYGNGKVQNGNGINMLNGGKGNMQIIAGINGMKHGNGSAVCDGSCEEQGQALQDGTGNMYGNGKVQNGNGINRLNYGKGNMQIVAGTNGMKHGNGSVVCDGSCEEQGQALQDGTGNMYGKDSQTGCGGRNQPFSGNRTVKRLGR